jgi:hypothetical protein
MHEQMALPHTQAHWMVALPTWRLWQAQLPIVRMPPLTQGKRITAALPQPLK